MEVKPGYKQTEAGVIPEDWVLRPLGEVVMFLDGKRRPVKDVDRVKMRGSIPYYGASGIVDYVNDYLFDEELILLGEDGENILSRNCRLAFRVSGKVWVNNHAHVLKPNPDISLGFLTDYLESLNYEQYNSGTAQPKLNKHTCFRIPVALPPTKAEQEAIAGALSDADALIEALEQLVAKKRHVKQGAMQELLTGKKRVPGLTGEWELKQFGEIAQLRTERVDPGRSGRFEFCIELEHMEQGTGCLVGNTTTSEGSSLKSVFRENDVLFGKLRAYLRKYWLADRAGVCSTEIWVLTPKAARVTSDYLFQLVKVDGFIDAATTAYGTHMPRSDWNVVKKYELSLPSPSEQAAIAAILADMDAEIATLEAKLAKARQIKQGMMQELLTGRIRLV
ncbi:MAG: restriction endonuclease subunit S [Planctomycetes bacterium]|nr:restriction endonuclease subunit S [Planctomycetota bacterium]